MTPAEELTQAADKLDALLKDTTVGPWSVSDPILDVGGEHGFDVDGPHGGYVSRLSDPHDAHYIAAMNPLVGKRVAEWLRAEGDATAELTHQAGFVNGHALEIARLINGSAS